MHILMTADTIGGVWTYALELARALAQEDIQVSLATMGAPLTAEQWASAVALDNLKVYESQYKLEWMDQPWADVREAGQWLLDLEHALQPDLIHLNGYVHGALPWNSPVLVVGHSCVLSWWLATKGTAAPAAWETYRHEVTRGLRYADMVIAPTQAMASQLNRFYGPLAYSRTIYNGRSPVEFSPAPKKPLILAAGRLWDEAKNIAALDSIASKLAWPVHVAGDNDHPEGTRQPRRRNVRLLGRLGSAAMAQHLAAASIYALPAYYEPFGLSILEAGLSGCALVLGDIPSLREIWGDAAEFVPPADHAALQSSLSSLIEDDARREALGAKARTRALEFSTARMAGEYADMYETLSRRLKNQAPALAPLESR